MNLQNIINEIETVDPEFHERISPRRTAIKNMTGFGKKIALGALPLALGSLFTKAYGQTQPTAITDILNFALTLEYLESTFYNKGVPVHGAQVGAAGLTTIQTDENNHVKFLQSVLKTLNATAISSPNFDFTAKGTFPDPFQAANYDVFLALAQAFEDTGVRAYKGQAPNLMSNKTVLTGALNIHSVEARHASHLRQMRKARGTTTEKPWITGTDRGGLPAPAQPVYNGEDFDNKAGSASLINMAFNGVTLSSDAVTEAFDEPLSYADAYNIAKLFLA